MKSQSITIIQNVKQRMDSPDIAPSDYHLFRSMAHGPADQHFPSYDECKEWAESWILWKDASFFREGIRQLPDRWDKVMANDRQYFEP